MFKTKLLCRLFFYALLMLASVAVVALSIDYWVTYGAKDKIYHDIDTLPDREIGLVPGTSKYIRRDLNPYYQYRIETAYKLFEDGKIKAFLLSGDNAHRSYNEPWTMKRDLLKKGVPENDIHLDYAGFSTLDSVVRAKQVFETDHFTIVTQQFHCERALFIAKHRGIDAICLAVPGPEGWAAVKIRIREIAARVKAFLDIYLLDTTPRFTGPKEPLSIQEPPLHSAEQ